VQERPGELKQEKTVVVSEETEGVKRDVKAAQIQKPSRRPIAPRFVSPITGMIVDQGADVVLEGIIDGEYVRFCDLSSQRFDNRRSILRYMYDFVIIYLFPSYVS